MERTVSRAEVAFYSPIAVATFDNEILGSPSQSYTRSFHFVVAFSRLHRDIFARHKQLENLRSRAFLYIHSVCPLMMIHYFDVRAAIRNVIKM